MLLQTLCIEIHMYGHAMLAIYKYIDPPTTSVGLMTAKMLEQ